MGTDLVHPLTSEHASLVPLPDIEAATALIRQLITDHQADVLDEARRRAEVAALYERRAQNVEREEHFWKLGVLVEAALGVLSFDDPSVVESYTKRTEWRAYAAAFERNALLDLCDAALSRGSKKSRTNVLMGEIRNRGYTYAPGRYVGKSGTSLPWGTARSLGLAKGVNLASIPPDKDYARKRDLMRSAAVLRGRQQTRLAERYARMKRTQATKDAAKADPKIAAAYSFLRKTMDAMGNAQAGRTREERHALEEIWRHLHAAEDLIGDFLHVPR